MDAKRLKLSRGFLHNIFEAPNYQFELASREPCEFDDLIKRAKQKEAFKLTPESVREMGKTFFTSVILFGSVEAVGTVALSCLFRNIIGEFRRPTTIFLPGVIGGLAVLNQDTKTRLFYSSYFVNAAMSLFLRRLNNTGRLRLTLPVKTGTFMLLSSAISGLFKQLGDKAHRYQFYWFFKPWSYLKSTDEAGESSATQCYHLKTCRNHVFNDFFKYYTTGFLLTAIRILFKHGASLLTNPRLLFRCICEKDTHMLGAFFGMYAFIFQATRCCLHRSKGETTVSGDMLAGCLAGSAFVLQPSATIFNYAIITVAQILTRICREKELIPDWPFTVIFYAIANGILFEAAILYGDCPNLPMYVIRTATNGRTQYFLDNFQRVLNKSKH